MTNEEAINELLQCYSLYSPFKAAKKTNEAISMAIKALKDKDIDVPTKWIPVAINPPKEEKSYLVWLDCGGVCECRWTDGDYLFGKPTGVWRWNFIDIPRHTKILAWMSMPEPYKEGEENGNVN